MSVPVSTVFGVHQLGMHSTHPPSPHSGGHHTPSVSSAFSLSAADAAQYVNGAGELSAATAYAMPGDVRSAPDPWFITSTSDPRFATDYTLQCEPFDEHSTGRRHEHGWHEYEHEVMNMPSIGAACGMTNNETSSKPWGVQFPLHAQRRRRRILFTQAQNSPKRVSVPVQFIKDYKAENGSTLVSICNNNGHIGGGGGGDNSCSTTLGTQPSPSSVACRDDDCTPSPGPTASLLGGGGMPPSHHPHHHLAAHLSQSQVDLHHAAAAAVAGEHHTNTSAMYLTSQALGLLGFYRQALIETP